MTDLLVVDDEVCWRLWQPFSAISVIMLRLYRQARYATESSRRQAPSPIWLLSISSCLEWLGYSYSKSCAATGT
jgi:hypothetical protein